MEKTIFLCGGGQLTLCPSPDAPQGTVLICPGGGYQWLSPREAEPVAEAFTAGGWAAAILYYSVRTGPDAPPLADLPLRQLGEAVARLRALRPQSPLVVCGFSAGGHLAASLGANWQALDLPRPDALVLGYPVTTAGTYAHRGSFENLAGQTDWTPYDIPTRVTAAMPPVFFWHTVTDPEVPVENSLLLAEALRRAGVSYELHLFPWGVHGLSLATPAVDEPEKGRLADPHVAGWFRLCLEWLATLKPSKE